MKKKIFYGGIALTVGGVTTALFLIASGSSAASLRGASPKTLVTVYGSATTWVTPTTAQIMLGVENQATLAQTALSQNNQTMNQIIGAIEKLGIPKTAISTNGININPQYNQANPPAVRAYQVSDNLTINASIALAGKVIDKAVAAGANQVNGINFVAPQVSSYQAIYKDALQNAHYQAASIAQGLKENIIGVQSVIAQTGGGGAPEPSYLLAQSAPNTPVLGGQQQNTLTLEVIYQLGK